MNKRNTKAIELTSFDDLIGWNENMSNDDTKDKVIEISLDDLYTFKNHPFDVQDDDEMSVLVESIREFGVLNPGIVRSRATGGYEIIAGHRRKHACELVGLDTMPFIIKELSDDEATIIMVDSNLYRENIKPHEKAFAYRMKMEAIKHQGIHIDGSDTAEQIKNEVGDTIRTVQRYIRLTFLNKEWLEMVDDGKLAMTSGVSLSYLREEEQAILYDLLQEFGIMPSSVQVDLLKEKSKEGLLSREYILSIVLKRKVEKPKIVIKAKKLEEFFPENTSQNEMEEIIFQLLENWKNENNG
jgi:ParB family chromosome partitioning protein